MLLCKICIWPSKLCHLCIFLSSLPFLQYPTARGYVDIVMEGSYKFNKNNLETSLHTTRVDEQIEAQELMDDDAYEMPHFSVSDYTPQHKKVEEDDEKKEQEEADKAKPPE